MTVCIFFARKPTATAAWTKDDRTPLSSNASCIDCRLHTVQPLPNMPIPMAYTVAGVLDGKVMYLDTAV
ncbi:hypothetical protein Bca52824_048560 [Brassica carinata]|uniref:Uncharacterized protein n=1 Tax=Brassica carinata TaxID=52824 RepID=A0A8X7RIM5_BRACI|nr:hypothetical protein Bca52824_048560 [Brassica carinata]